MKNDKIKQANTFHGEGIKKVFILDESNPRAVELSKRWVKHQYKLLGIPYEKE